MRFTPPRLWSSPILSKCSQADGLRDGLQRHSLLRLFEAAPPNTEADLIAT